MPDSSNLPIRCNLILPIIMNVSQIDRKYALNPNAGKIHRETNDSEQLCLGNTPEANS